MAFDLKTAVPVLASTDKVEVSPGFDLNTARPMPEDMLDSPLAQQVRQEAELSRYPQLSIAAGERREMSDRIAEGERFDRAMMDSLEGEPPTPISVMTDAYNTFIKEAKGPLTLLKAIPVVAEWNFISGLAQSMTPENINDPEALLLGALKNVGTGDSDVVTPLIEALEIKNPNFAGLLSLLPSVIQFETLTNGLGGKLLLETPTEKLLPQPLMVRDTIGAAMLKDAQLARQNGLRQAGEFFKVNTPEKVAEDIRQLFKQGKLQLLDYPDVETATQDLTQRIFSHWSTSLYKARVAGAIPTLRSAGKLLGREGSMYVPDNRAIKIAQQIMKGEKVVIPPEIMEQVTKAMGSVTPTAKGGEIAPELQSLAEEARKYKSADEFIASLEKQGKISFHGTPNDFEDFSYEFIGTQGTSEGKGFYFTNDKGIAKGYMKADENGNLSGKLIEAYIDVKKPLSLDKKEITLSKLKKFIKAIDADGQGYLSNWGDVTTEGYDAVLNNAAKSEYEGSDNDVDLISSIVNASAGGNPESIYPILKKTLGYDGIVAKNASWGKGQTITVAFSNDQIITKKKLTDLHSKLSPTTAKGGEIDILDVDIPRGSKVVPLNYGALDNVGRRSFASVAKDNEVDISQVRQANIPLDELSPKYKGSADPDEMGSLDNQPAVEVTLTKNGKFKINDGNHRISAAQEQGYTHIPAWVIDKRSKLSPKESGVSDQQIAEFILKNAPKKTYTPKTLTGLIQNGGGIDFSKDYNVKEMREFGLKNTPGARTPDDWAMSLVEEGLIQVPNNMNPGDHLMELLKSKKDRKIANPDSLVNEELKRQKEDDKQAKVIAKARKAQLKSEIKKLSGIIKTIQEDKALSVATMSRLKKFFDISELKNANTDQLNKLIDFLKTLKPGDSFLSDKKVKALSSLMGEVENLEITPKRILIDQFGEKEEILQGSVVGRLSPELIPTIDIKQGHPLITKIVDEADRLLEYSRVRVDEFDADIEKLISRAEKSRRKKLSLIERTQRALSPQNIEIFRALGGEKVDLTAEEKDAVNFLQNTFKLIRDDLKLEKWRKNYITHMEKDLTEKLLTQGLLKTIAGLFDSKESDIPVNLMLELDNIIGSEKFFKYAMQRKGGIDPTTNIRKILHDYYSLYETKKSLDAILPEGQAIVHLLLKGKSAKWLKQYLQNLKGRGLDFNFRTGPMGMLTKIADAIVDIGYLKLLGLNESSALKNIIAGESNSFVWQDLKTYLTGKKRLLSNPKRVLKLAQQYGILDGTYAEYAQKGIGKLKKAQDVMMIGQRAGEWEIRGSLFASELTDDEWKSGVISDSHLREIKDEIAITQGIFSKSESPLFVQTWYGRLFTQMNRWRITNAMLFRRIAQGVKNEIAGGNFNGKNMKRLQKMIIMYALSAYIGYELRKAGYKQASRMAQGAGQLIQNVIELITLGPIAESISDNPTLSTLKEIAFSSQDFANYIAPWAMERPQAVEIQQGIEDTYIVPVEKAKSFLEGLE